MTYTELQTLIQNYLENSETTFVGDLPQIIKQAEERILKSVKLPVFRKNVTGTLSAGNQFLSTPSDFLDNFSLAIGTGTNLDFLYFRDVNFIREAYPDTSLQQKPQHYALYDDNSFIVAPVPNLDYAAELHYFYRPASLTAGAGSGTTWLSENASNALLYGCLVESYVYMKGSPELQAEYEKRYFQAISRLQNLGEADNTIDTYSNGTFKRERS
tara:strand:- start:1149 stop:1790 length:642 start_codon:yes stop_codon:yes gene_type:complete